MQGSGTFLLEPYEDPAPRGGGAADGSAPLRARCARLFGCSARRAERAASATPARPPAPRASRSACASTPGGPMAPMVDALIALMLPAAEDLANQILGELEKRQASPRTRRRSPVAGRLRPLRRGGDPRTRIRSTRGCARRRPATTSRSGTPTALALRGHLERVDGRGELLDRGSTTTASHLLTKVQPVTPDDQPDGSAASTRSLRSPIARSSRRARCAARGADPRASSTRRSPTSKGKRRPTSSTTSRRRSR